MAAKRKALERKFQSAYMASRDTGNTLKPRATTDTDSPHKRISESGRVYYTPANRQKYSVYIQPAVMELARTAVLNVGGTMTLSTFFEQAVQAEADRLAKKKPFVKTGGKLNRGPKPKSHESK